MLQIDHSGIQRISTNGMSEDEIMFRIQVLHKDTERMKSRFAGLVFDLQKSVERTHKLEDVLDILKFRDRNFPQQLHDCKTISQAFCEASSYWSYYDYEIVKLMTNQLGTEKCKQRLKRYQMRLKHYSKRRVCECPSNAFGRADRSEKVLSLKSNLPKLEELTLEEFEKFESAIKVVFRRRVLRLLDLNEDSIELNFRTLDDSVIDITDEQKSALKNMGFVNIKYGDISFDLSSLNTSEEADMHKSEKGEECLKGTLATKIFT